MRSQKPAIVPDQRSANRSVPGIRKRAVAETVSSSSGYVVMRQCNAMRNAICFEALPNILARF